VDPTRVHDVPVIDLGGRREEVPPPPVVDAVADAAATYEFFQVVDHGIPADEIEAIWGATRAFFDLDAPVKLALSRSRDNTRGYYDRELTKNRRDLKEVLDIAQVPYPDLPDDHPANALAVDGRNQWPDLPGFRDTVNTHLAMCDELATWLLAAFALGLGEAPDRLDACYRPVHTSFLRMNHYPLEDPLPADDVCDVASLGDMALHHHTDAGALTVLFQDDVGGLQVEIDGEWIDVAPVPGAAVINSGDIMQVWSNDRFRAASHRVRPVVDRARYSLPYFFNPGYETEYAPLPGSIAPGDTAHYRSINWGDFRQARADGDYADYGAEVQIADFRLV
jgi:isopenicillin N synthase-like dioxygenase